MQYYSRTISMWLGLRPQLTVYPGCFLWCAFIRMYRRKLSTRSTNRLVSINIANIFSVLVNSIVKNKYAKYYPLLFMNVTLNVASISKSCLYTIFWYWISALEQAWFEYELCFFYKCEHNSCMGINKTLCDQNTALLTIPFGGHPIFYSLHSLL